MKARLKPGLAVRLAAVVIAGLAILLTGETDAARYTYESTIVPENSITKLDQPTYVFLTEYGKELQNFSNAYGVDWRLALAVLRQESAFDPAAISNKGAEGFMQLMPVTGYYLASLYNISDISNPTDNIKLGVIHLHDLLEDFPDTNPTNRIRLAVAAYNCGLTRVQDAETVARFLGDSPNRWASIKSALPLLSSRYSPLHAHIWSAGRPTGGYFGGYHETISYVENVMHYYNIYRNVLQK